VQFMAYLFQITKFASTFVRRFFSMPLPIMPMPIKPITTIFYQGYCIFEALCGAKDLCDPQRPCTKMQSKCLDRASVFEHRFLTVNAVGFLIQLTKQLCSAMQSSRLSVTTFILLLLYLGVEGAVFRANELRLKEEPPSFVAGGAGLTGAAGFTALFSLF
jgi:hypothetical protein